MNVFSHYQGQILVNGEDIKQICKEDIDRIFAIVTQVPMAMNGTIRENVDITNTLTDEEIYHYLDLVELKDDIENSHWDLIHLWEKMDRTFQEDKNSVLL